MSIFHATPPNALNLLLIRRIDGSCIDLKQWVDLQKIFPTQSILLVFCLPVIFTTIRAVPYSIHADLLSSIYRTEPYNNAFWFILKLDQLVAVIEDPKSLDPCCDWLLQEWTLGLEGRETMSKAITSKDKERTQLRDVHSENLGLGDVVESPIPNSYLLQSRGHRLGWQ